MKSIIIHYQLITLIDDTCYFDLRLRCLVFLDGIQWQKQYSYIIPEAHVKMGYDRKSVTGLGIHSISYLVGLYVRIMLGWAINVYLPKLPLSLEVFHTILSLSFYFLFFYFLGWSGNITISNNSIHCQANIHIEGANKILIHTRQEIRTYSRTVVNSCSDIVCYYLFSISYQCYHH